MEYNFFSGDIPRTLVIGLLRFVPRPPVVGNRNICYYGTWNICVGKRNLCYYRTWDICVGKLHLASLKDGSIGDGRLYPTKFKKK